MTRNDAGISESKTEEIQAICIKKAVSSVLMPLMAAGCNPMYWLGGSKKKNMKTEAYSCFCKLFAEKP
ncbi:hypothetical protein Gasu2_43990 [Galdieria sulphuraria]|uniref:Uncharacterized protein n=1 Tax=Galdieria sulphuraria TaxID=130081 RepID=M2VWZ7_GALSU|nr:uncharacterized protein Gasu_47620 [Galdieria sulphuraria]EME27776.1 hypothetical protein Gasu_47620 [Galdieria sulphuraria]GJD10191.1 hypothetical protein Gasu2_43990 [Galdieria sulphuraria]|eukprot:XP_005704296.1 hypothetical protein Gasu_47620 [Galdieria sulphuraria]